VASLPSALLSYERPLVPLGVAVPYYYGKEGWNDTLLGRSILTASRIDLYFTHRTWGLRDPYREASDFLKARGDSQIGLLLPRDEWEYPLWVLLGADGTRDVQLEHLMVKNISAAAGDDAWKTFRPSAIVKVRALFASHSDALQHDEIDREFG